MRMSDYWHFIHGWNENIKGRRRCLVCIVDQPFGVDSKEVNLMDYLALDFATAAAHGRLLRHEDAMRRLRPTVHINATVEPVEIGPA